MNDICPQCQIPISSGEGCHMATLHRDPAYWDNYFLGLAEYVSRPSKDPSTKVGAVIVDPERRIVSTGYNGFPAGVEDTPERLNNRDLKYLLTIHSEHNAALFADKSIRGCTVYVWPFQPCSKCAGVLIQRGITRVVAPQSNNPRWAEDFKLSTQIFKEAGVLVDLLPVSL